MRPVVVSGFIALLLGAVASVATGDMLWLGVGGLVLVGAIFAVGGHSLFEASVEPYDIGEEPPPINPVTAENELRRKDRGSVVKEKGAS